MHLEIDNLEIEKEKINEPGVAKVNDKIAEHMRYILYNIALSPERYYTMVFPLFWSSAHGDKSSGEAAEDASLKKSEDSTPTPVKFFPLRIRVEAGGADANLKCFRLEQTHIELAPKGRIIKDKVSEKCYSTCLKENKVTLRDKTPVNNYAYLSYFAYRIIQISKQDHIAGEYEMSLSGSAAVNGRCSSLDHLDKDPPTKREIIDAGSSPPLLCKIGDYHYFCMVKSGFQAEDSIAMNSIYFRKFNEKKIDVIPCYDFVLKNAGSCEIKLSWHLFPKSIMLDSGDIHKKVKEAVSQTPLEKGKKFLIPLSDEGEESTVIQGEIIGFDEPSEPETREPKAFMMIDDSTQLHLSAEDSVLLRGGKVQRKIQTEKIIINELIRGMAGMRNVAQQVYDNVISLLTAYKEEKIDTLAQRGIIFTGSPGNGKTHIARNLIEVLSLYLSTTTIAINHKLLMSSGKETYQAINDGIIQKAKQSLPYKGHIVVVFLDELDTLIMGKKAKESISDSKSVFKTVLQTCMSDGPKNLFFIATSNKPLNHFGSALTRAGRFGIHICIDNPEQKQREAILKQSFDNKGFDYSQLSITDLARRTGGKPASDLIDKVDLITTEAVLRGANKERVVTDQDVDSALVKPERIKTNYQQAVSLISDKIKDSELLTSEWASLQQAKKVINRVRGRMGKHAVVLVKADQGRTEPFCYHLLKTVHNKPTEDVNKALLPFHDFIMVPFGKKMLLKAHNAINDIEIAQRTLVIVDRVDMLLKEKYETLSPSVLGQEWKRIAGSNSQCAALVMTYSDDKLTTKKVVQEMGIQWVNENITVVSTPTKAEYEKVIDQFNVTEDMKVQLLNEIHQGFNISFLEHLLTLYVKTNDRGETILNIQEILEVVKLNKKQHLSMFF